MLETMQKTTLLYVTIKIHFFMNDPLSVWFPDVIFIIKMESFVFVKYDEDAQRAQQLSVERNYM